MTDSSAIPTQAVPATTSQDEKKNPFQIVPTIDGYMELADRVTDVEDRLQDVEAHVPATVGEYVEHEPDEIDDIHDRLNRHRTEIEEIKKRYNALIRFIGTNVPTTGNTPIPPAAQPASFMQQ